MKSSVPDLRLTPGHGAVRADGDYVLYWMTMARRRRSNFALQRAVDWCRHLGKPLLVLEALRCDYPWASDRMHRFVLDGMRDNAVAFADGGARYYAYVEPERGAGKGLLRALAERACVVVGDEFPCFMLPRMTAAARAQVTCAFELVDGNGLLPMRAADKAFARAFDFRRFLQKVLAAHLGETPHDDPLARANLLPPPAVPRSILQRWPEAGARLLGGDGSALAALPIDHDVPIVADVAGGAEAGRRRLLRFCRDVVARYEERNLPDADATSGLSPYLHFGHVGAHEVLAAVLRGRDWSPERASARVTGQATGWWGLPTAVEGFLDQAVTWRELGYNACFHLESYDEWESLPGWARATLDQHASDARPHVYAHAEFETARTHDPLWNAAQTQLRREGIIHNYLRMLWGKKILEWSPTPRAALATMIELNNRWALDGRNPNSYTGIFWCLGRYDRPWAPERPIFGIIRYMSSDSAMRKIKPRAYLQAYGADSGGLLFGR
ncbi:MAG: deoxyribodipyrimidine photolyase [Planctomycetota bacterium]